MAKSAAIEYNDFVILPTSATDDSDCIGKCKRCAKDLRYSPASKGNLLKHLETAHAESLAVYRRNKNDGKQGKQKLELAAGVLQLHQYPKQSQVTDALITCLLGKGALFLAYLISPGFANLFILSSRVIRILALSNCVREQASLLLPLEP